MTVRKLVVITTAKEDDSAPAAGLDRIRELNDAFRTTLVSGYIIISRRVARLGRKHVGEVLKAVMDGSGFEMPPNPRDTHVSGTLDCAGVRLVWRIDYLDEKVAGPSPDPADAARPRRVLTVMLAEA